MWPDSVFTDLVSVVNMHVYINIYMYFTLFQPFNFFLLPQPSKIGGCLDGDLQLEYIVDFNGTLFNSDVAKDTNYLLLDVPLGIILEVTITPRMPVLELSGPSFSKTFNLGKVYVQPNLYTVICIFFVVKIFSSAENGRKYFARK